ncbi:hypothetical protein ThidrDRAFT_4475 [Thiorhodococcus drewsii AZ1]|uniref:CHAT domain-containing protein n=1 Tax=Thiorhodococcus drewsii AZ1 TaxID=765913 RepID=G2E861_9GAMM|nr:hypothetical protein [Thiorhodococcus drewsii]EGV27713.1 hypothetical protein ThidrDRAFT_4475 [Thiorhodococcus drewsii AZ1]
MGALETLQELAQVWIWGETDGVRWCSPQGIHRLAQSSPTRSARPAMPEALEAGRPHIAFEQALAPDLAARLAALLDRHPGVRLHVSEDLPAPWHACPFEWLMRDGVSLHGRLSVLRYQRLPSAPRAPLSPRREIAVLNLLPGSEPVQPADAAAGDRVQVYDGFGAVDCFLRRADLVDLAALVLVAHGSERASDHPFRLADGRPWRLPLEFGLPPLVLLLACGSPDGNLIAYGRELLGAGAEAVIAPHGRPSQAGARDFLAEFLPRWRAGAPLEAILLDLQRPAHDSDGARLMQILGRGDLRVAERPRPEEMDDEALAEAAREGDGSALGQLSNRLTLRCFQTQVPLDEAEQALRTGLEVPGSDESAEAALLRSLGDIELRLWPLTRAWVVPLLALLADAYDQRQSPRFEAERRAMDRPGIPQPAPVFHYWSRLYYRQGRYPLAVQDVARGLAQLEAGDLCGRGAGLVGQLIGLLIDLNLPDPARRLSRDLDDCLSRHRGQRSDWEAHKLKDRTARIALRRGRAERALGIYRLKRREAANFGGDGRRELAWLLYIGAWSGHPDSAGWAGEVAEILDGLIPTLDQVGFGNGDEIYLLRAYAAWAWLGADAAARARLLRFGAFLRERLVVGDPGPPGFALAFMHLAGGEGGDPDHRLPSWDEVCAVLDQKRYYLELAALSALAGYPQDAEDGLERFQAQRRLPTALDLPDWLGDGVLAEWDTSSAERARFERERILGPQRCSARDLVQAGLLPL